jgi:hypothetical protein
VTTIAYSNPGDDSSDDSHLDPDLSPSRVGTGALLASGHESDQQASSVDSDAIDTRRDPTAATSASNSMSSFLCYRLRTSRWSRVKALGE